MVIKITKFIWGVSGENVTEAVDRCVLRGLDDPSPFVRRIAVCASQHFLLNESSRDDMLACINRLVKDSDPIVSSNAVQLLSANNAFCNMKRYEE